jgi:uncharacterized protein DUF4440
MSRKIALALFLMAFFLSGRVQAQSLEELRQREIAKQRDMKQEELVNLEQDAARAMQWNSGSFFRRVYGEEFLGVLPSGQLKDKAGWISSIEDPSTKYSSFVATDIRVRMYQETAVVTCLWSMRGTQGGRTFNRQVRVIHVYIYGMRGWQVVASQETLLPG